MNKLFKNVVLRTLLGTDALIMLATAMLGPIYALFVKEVGGDLLDASLTAATFALAAGVTTFFAGKYADKIKRSQLIIVFGYFIMAIGFGLYTQVNSIYSLLLVQIVIGFGEAIYAPAYDALFSKHLDRRKEGTQWGIWEATSYFTTGIGSILGGFIAYNYGFNALFLTMAVLCLTSSLFLYLFLK